MFERFLDPKNDFAFKKVFGTEKNKDILISFLNDMIVFKEGFPITDVTFIQTTLDPELMFRKVSIVDVLCKDTHGNRYIVEMQVAREKGFEKRAQYYAAKVYTGQAHQGHKYTDLKAVIFLAICDFVVFPEKKHFKSDHITLDKETYENDLKDFSYTFLELPKFHKKSDELENNIDRWCYFFKNAESSTPLFMENVMHDYPCLDHAYRVLNQIQWSEDELMLYQQMEKDEWDRVAQLDQKYDEGMEKGINQTKIIMAKKLLEKGIDIHMIEEITGLSSKDL